ncbi:MAG: hypothetical protein HOP12_15645, partial [Candidatus Eisenbacteria bacterium]|nr:hypothetical protein [Candidatus Eisenbacteria bacterium]
KYVASYTLLAATEDDVDYGLYTFALNQSGTGTPGDPASFSVQNLTFLYNDPATDEYDAQVIAARAKPPVIASTLNPSVDYGEFIAQDVFNRGLSDGQERPIRGTDPIDSIAVIVARPTRPGEMNDFSANEYEKRELLGFAPVQSDGSFHIRVPANTPISFATMDVNGRGFVVKRTHIAVRNGEVFDKCVGCHEDRHAGGPTPTNPNPIAALMPAHDLNIAPAQRQIINYETTIGPIVAAKCASCHTPTIPGVDSTAAGQLNLTSAPDTVRMNRIFPKGYVSLSGEMMMGSTRPAVTRPGFPRQSTLIDYVMGLGSQSGIGQHPSGPNALTAAERRKFNLWVLLGAQYK